MTEQGPIYPNSMILLVGNASAGKGPAIDPVEQLLYRLDTGGDILHLNEGIHMGPGDATVAGLFDELLDEISARTYNYNGKTYSFHSTIIIAEELSAFMHHVDNQMMGYLIKFLNCRQHSQRLRSTGEVKIVENPVLHILGGVQPKMLSQIFPPQAFGMGLTARTTFVFSDEQIKVSPFAKRDRDIALEDKLVHDLRRISKLAGPFKIREDAAEFIEDWWMNKSDQDKPSHPKLDGYNGKRILHLFRLCMIHSIAKNDSLIIELEDVEQSLADLLEVEVPMSRIFETMTGETSHEDVFADISHQLITLHTQTGRPVPYHVLVQMVRRKVRAQEITPVITSLIEQQIIEEVQVAKIKVPGTGAKAFIPGKGAMT